MNRLQFIPLYAAISLSTVTLGACATTPDPAKVCTADWIKPRTAKAVKEVKRDTGRTIKSLKKNAEKMSKGGILAPYRAANMFSSVQKLANSIQKGRGVRDLKTLAATCDDPKILRDGLVGYMEDVEAPKMLLDLVRDFDFEKMTEQAKAAIDAKPDN